jgi:hypothetical protein
MPTVRNYGGPRVETQALPGVRRTAAPTEETFGKSGGDKLLKVGLALYEDEILRQDQVAVLEADRKLSDWELRRMHDPREGALARRGKDAFGLPDTIGQEFDKAVGEIRQGLTTERQRIAFDRHAESRRNDIRKTLSRHVFNEVRKFDDAETENYLKNAQQAALVNYHDPERISIELERQRAAIVDFSARHGLGTEYVKQKTAQAVSHTHVGVIQRMLANGQDGMAEKYFNAVKSEIAGDDIAQVEKALAVAVTEGAGMRAADDIWQQIGPKNDIAPVNLDVMVEEVKKRHSNDPKLIKAATAALKERAAIHNGAQKERAEANEAAVWSAVANGQSLNNVRRMPEYLALPGSAQERVKNHIVDRAFSMSQRARTLETQADADRSKRYFAAYLTYSNPETLHAMSENEIMSLLPVLGNELTGRLMEKKRSFMKSADAVRAATIDDDLFKQAADRAGLEPYATKHGSDKEERDARLGRLKNHVETLIDIEQRAKGRVLTREEKAVIMQSEIEKKVMLDVWGRDPVLPAAAVKPDQAGKAYVPLDQVPPEVVTQAVNYLRSIGRVPLGISDQAAARRMRARIERAYGARLTGASREQIEAILQGKD